MIFLEHQARFWLLVHLILGVAVTGAATHQVLWMRSYLRGKYGRHRAVRRFSAIVLALYAANFVVGNLIYPTYKIRVRAGYFDDAAAAAAEHETRATQRAQLDTLAGAAPTPAPAFEPEHLAAIGRWFDVKEHWIGLGFVLALASALILRAWDPRSDGAAAVPIVFALAVAVAATTWAVSFIGAVVTSFRAIGT